MRNDIFFTRMERNFLNKVLAFYLIKNTTGASLQKIKISTIRAKKLCGTALAARPDFHRDYTLIQYNFN